MTDYARLHGYVSGRVQGVGFRYFVEDAAGQYKLTGWVKNLFDGKVEFAAEGPKGLLSDFLKDVSRGPITGHVSNVDAKWENYTGEFERFMIKF